MEKSKNQLIGQTLKELSKWHDCVKGHPYLIGFDQKYYGDFLSSFHKMQSLFYNIATDFKYSKKFHEETINYYQSPQAAVIVRLTHDVNVGVSKMYFKEQISKYILQTTAYISLIHSFINGDTENVLGYHGNTEVRAIKDEAGDGYRSVFVYNDKEDTIRKYGICKSKWPNFYNAIIDDIENDTKQLIMIRNKIIQ